MLNRNPDREWEKFGKNDPYYGVMVLDKFHKQDLDQNALAEFFTSGREHVEYIMDTTRALFGSDFAPSRALDFGCGVGRCVIPLARVCSRVVGVDVSASMIEEAKRNCTGQGVANVDLMTSVDDLSNIQGTFDLIHSSFVFQHIPHERAETIFARLVERLSENGVGSFDFLIHRNVPAFATAMGFCRRNVPLFNNLANLLHGKPFAEPLMEKVVHNLNRIVTILHDKGCGNLYLKLFRNGNQQHAILFFQRKPDKAPPHEAFYNKS